MVAKLVEDRRAIVEFLCHIGVLKPVAVLQMCGGRREEQCLIHPSIIHSIQSSHPSVSYLVSLAALPTTTVRS